MNSGIVQNGDITNKHHLLERQKLKHTYSGVQLCVVQVFCNLGLVKAKHEWTEAGVSSSDLTQLTSRL